MSNNESQRKIKRAIEMLPTYYAMGNRNMVYCCCQCIINLMRQQEPLPIVHAQDEYDPADLAEIDPETGEIVCAS